MAEEKNDQNEQAAQPEEYEQNQEAYEEESPEGDDYSEEPESVVGGNEEEVQQVQGEEDTSSAGASVDDSWQPKTSVGRSVKTGEITDIDEILGKGIKILEPEIVSALLPNLEVDLLAIGQSKGKFGGGQRRVFRQTQKKTREGNKPKFSAFAICGNYDGYVGYGFGKTKETVPAREKAFRNCKLNVFKIRRGCSSWECTCGNSHTIPFRVTGKCGSVEVTFMPAPKGIGLCVEKETAKILKLAGIQDVWSKTKGKTNTKVNHIKACLDALKKLARTRVRTQDIKNLHLSEGKSKIKVEN